MLGRRKCAPPRPCLAPLGVHKGHRDHKNGPRPNGRTLHGNVEIATSCADREALPQGNLHSFDLIDTSELPEQATQFRCYLKVVSIKWQ
jgi:hypothetical protein